jgi:transposase
LEDSLPVEGLVEVDERYFRGVRKGKRGRGGADEIPVFGILKRGGKVTTVMIPDVPKDTLLPIIQREVVPIRSSIPTLIPL